MSDVLPKDAAFALLQEVVNDFQSRGRTTVTAGIKPEMQRRSPVGFAEANYGHERFTEFLREAEGAGIIEMSRWRKQPVVLLPGQPIEAAGGEPAAGRHGSQRPQVRADLWEAFTNWGDWIRLWDSEEDRAFRLPSDPHRDRAIDLDRRKAWEASPERFVVIPGISQEIQLGWMNSFADRQHGRSGLMLRFALSAEERKAQAFSQVAREDPSIYSSWLDLRVAEVVDHITAWRDEGHLAIEIFERDAGITLAAGPSIPPKQVQLSAPIGDVEAQLREMAHHAVDAMSVDELMALPIRLGHVLRRP